jgi:hypothetical protein
MERPACFARIDKYRGPSARALRFAQDDGFWGRASHPSDDEAVARMGTQVNADSSAALRNDNKKKAGE